MNRSLHAKLPLICERFIRRKGRVKGGDYDLAGTTLIGRVSQGAARGMLLSPTGPEWMQLRKLPGYRFHPRITGEMPDTKCRVNAEESSGLTPPDARLHVTKINFREISARQRRYIGDFRRKHNQAAVVNEIRYFLCLAFIKVYTICELSINLRCPNNNDNTFVGLVFGTNAKQLKNIPGIVMTSFRFQLHDKHLSLENTKTVTLSELCLR
ncbi:hypothetical protein WN51_07665 [Melipona quadrifasciata]|uniref:Uncharacterized protein n=1 Tax=Melipona quadrifasciata TaxID=166423 RepID=A0A0N0BBR1_9HYME|nr:hypothetical protein WN51_07665 [Melipona quadrifasciata]